MSLLVIGAITLVAMRFFGVFGLAVLAPSALLAPATGMAQFIGMYAAMRALLQVYIVTFNSNVTGINIMHPYSGAGQYAGFAIVIALLVALRQIHQQAWLAATFIGTSLALPALSNYFFHAEATASLLLSITVAASVLAIFGRALGQNMVVAYENFMLLPFAAIATAVLTGELIQTGNLVTNAAKVSALEGLVGVFAALVFGFWAFARFRPRQALENSAK